MSTTRQIEVNRRDAHTPAPVVEPAGAPSLTTSLRIGFVLSTPHRPRPNPPVPVVGSDARIRQSGGHFCKFSPSMSRLTAR